MSALGRKNEISWPLQVAQEHPTSCSAKKLCYSGNFAGKIDPVLFFVGKVKYICWETFKKTF